MKRNNLFFVWIAFISSLTCHQSIAQKQSVYAFKNGTAFVVKNMEVKLDNKQYIIQDIPQATFGTLWFNSPGNSINQIRMVTKKQEETSAIKSVYHLMKANINKKAMIQTQDDQNFQGTIRQVDPELFLFETQDLKWLALKPNQVKHVTLLAKPMLTYKEKKEKESIQLNFANNSTQQNLEMMYLQKGISWVPNYSIDLLDDNRAKISLRALLMNEVEDLKNAQMSFVVGVPNFAYQYLLSPMTSTQNLNSFIHTLNTNSNQPVNALVNVNRGDITAQSFTNYAANEFDSNDLDSFVSDPIEPESNQNEFFFYEVSDITLKKGERGFYDIFEEEVDYESIYEVNLSSNSGERSGYNANHSYRDINQVWYSVQFDNKTQYPMTTGTAMVVERDGKSLKPVSQNKLSYVPIGGKAQMKITIASDISVRDSEKETSFVPNHKRINKTTYSLLKVEGKILVKNYKNKEVNLCVKRNIQGTLLTCNEDWNVTKLANRSRSYRNTPNKVEWNVKLPANKEKEIIYSYEILVRAF